MRALLSKSFFGVPEDDEYFNLPAAAEMYSRVAKMSPEAAEGFLQVVLFDVLTDDIRANAAEAQRGVDRLVAKRLDDASMGIVRSYISKRREGEDVTSSLAAAQVVAILKAADDDDEPHIAIARPIDQGKAHDPYRRDQAGRFSHIESRVTDVSYSGETKPLKRQSAARIGVPTPGDKVWSQMTPQQKTHYQQAHLQVASMLRDARAHGLDARVEATWEDPSGALFTVTQVGGSNKIVDPKQFRDDNKLVALATQHTATLGADGTYVGRDPSFAGATYNMVQGMGHPVAAQHLATQIDTGSLSAGRVREFEGQWNPRDDANPSTRFWGRMGAGSSLLAEALGPHAPDSLKYALQAGKWAGEYGPEAQKVIGPSADKAVYRYRGTEKQPSAGVKDAVDGLLRTHTPDEAREKMIYGTYVNTSSRPGDLGGEVVHHPSLIVDYFHRSLPSKELAELQIKSGTVPPSQGIVIDRSGKVVTEAVGYGDDHYLPFNLKNIGRLKGGEYVRTRTFGGPTTEDIYTGLVGNARALTVVSHSGVYTVEFDDTFRGSRRYNDKAARMVTRYGQLLDAVKNGEVSAADIPPDRERELEERANRLAPIEFDPARNREELTKLRNLEREHPQLSQEALTKVKVDFLNAKAEKVANEDGRMGNWRDLANIGMAREARPFLAAGDWTQEDKDRQMANLQSQYATPDQVAEKMGLTDQMNRSVDYAQAQNRRAMKPLRLDGPGYEAALKGLQEQFPYYISKVHYEPFVDGASGKRDTGYVNPGRNRPKAALSGYWDESLGQKKVSAQDTRFQNRRTNTATPVDFARKKVGESNDRGEKVDAETSRSSGSGVGGVSSVTPDTKESRAMDLMDAFRDIQDQIRESGYGADLRRNTQVLKLDEDEALEQVKNTPDIFAKLLLADTKDLKEKMSTTAYLASGPDKKPFQRWDALEKQILGAKGMADRRKPFRFSDAIIGASPNSDFDFGIPPGQSAEMLRTVAGNDPAVRAAFVHMQISELSAADAPAIDQSMQGIKSLYKKHADYKARKTFDPVPWNSTHEQAFEGLFKIKAYQKAIREAEERELQMATRSAAEVAAANPPAQFNALVVPEKADPEALNMIRGALGTLHITEPFDEEL